MCKTLLSWSCNSWSCSCSSSCAAEALLGHDTKTGLGAFTNARGTVLQLPSSISRTPATGYPIVCLRWLQDSHILAWTTTRRYRYFTIALVAVRVVLGYDAYYRSQSFTLSYKLLIDRAVFPYDYPGQLLLGYHM